MFKVRRFYTKHVYTSIIDLLKQYDDDESHEYLNVLLSLIQSLSTVHGIARSSERISYNKIMCIKKEMENINTLIRVTMANTTEFHIATKIHLLINHLYQNIVAWGLCGSANEEGIEQKHQIDKKLKWNIGALNETKGFELKMDNNFTLELVPFYDK